MTDGSSIAKSLLWEDYYDNMHDAYDAMHGAIKSRGLSQDKIAKRLKANKGLISKRINGSKNLTLKTLSFMATALECKLSIGFTPYEEVEAIETNASSRKLPLGDDDVQSHNNGEIEYKRKKAA